ncbi:uncharacterized protein V1513DRAFT_482101 [Lipomyces chichibuensis]|uniref:uncharacterized protein n=1 Tax=Lipomyces chichibuensis TaxID=1546026 RepID=UPI00334410DA
MPSTESSRNDSFSSFDKLKELEIASLSPTNATDSHFLSGEISLIWPYSSLTRQFSIQLCDADISKRIRKGQIKLIFGGKSVGKVADELMNSGDKLRIALKGSQVVRCEPSAISEFDSDWMCVWENGALVQINDCAPLQIVRDDTADENQTRSASSEVEDDEWIAAVSSPATPTAQTISGNVSIAPSSSSFGTSNVWFTPPDILRRRPRPSSDDTFSSGAFLEFDDDMAGPLRKRSKHSRSSSEWVYDDTTLQTHRILETEHVPEHVPAPVSSKEASVTNRVQLSSPTVPVINVTGMSLSARIESSTLRRVPQNADASIVRPAEPPESLHDENELYRDLMRQKDFEESQLSGQEGVRSILDDISVVTQAGSVVDQESVTHEDQDQRSENLEKAQSKLYYEILQAKLQNPGSNSLIASSAATVFDGFTASVEGSDGGKTVDDAQSSKSAEELKHVQHHHVVLESAPEPENDDIIPRYPGIGWSERVRSPLEEWARENIDYLRDNVDEMSAMEQVELAAAQTTSKPEPGPKSPPAEPVGVATADAKTVPESAATTIRDLSQPVPKPIAETKKVDAAGPAADEETLADISIEPERSQSLTTTEVIDSQPSALPVATFSGHEVTLEEVADETDIPDVIGNDELPPNPSSFEPSQEFNEVQSDISSAQTSEFLKIRPPEINAQSSQTQLEGLEVRSSLPQRGTLRSSPPIIKDQVAPEPVILQELPSQPEGSFPTQSHPEITDLEDETVDAEIIYNTPLVEAIMTPLMTNAHLSHDIESGPFNAFPALEVILDEEVVNKDDVIEASSAEVTDDAAVDGAPGGVFSNIGRLELIVAKGDIVFVEEELVTTEVEKPAPEEVAMEHVVGRDHAVPISEENISTQSPTGIEANDDTEKVDPLMYLMDFETQLPNPLHGEDEEMVVAEVRDELRALATQALFLQAVSEREDDDHDNEEADEEEEGFASQADDATSSPSGSGSRDDTSVEEDESTPEQQPISLSSSGTLVAPITALEVIEIDSDTSKECGEDQLQLGAVTQDDGENADFEQPIVPEKEERKKQQDEGGQSPPLEDLVAIDMVAISPEEYALQQLDISIGQLEAQAESYLESAKYAGEESADQYEEQDDGDSYSTSSMLDSEVTGENVDSIGAEEERLRKLEEGIVAGPTAAKTTSVSIDTVVESNSLKRTNLVAVQYAQGKGSKGEGRMPAGLNTAISDYPALDLIRMQYLGDFIGAVTSVTPTRWIEVDEDKHKEAKGRQCYVYVYITDPSYPRGETLKVYVSRMFEQALPIVKPGDVVLFRNFYVTMRKSKYLAVATLQSAWAVWKSPSSGDAESTVEVRGPPVEYGEQESLYAKKLRQWYLSTASGTADESDK